MSAGGTVDRPSVSVVVPVYRNEPELAELHRRIADALAGTSWEIVFVDDASPDGSARVLRELAERDPRVRVHTLARNAGQHRATLAGMRLTRGATIVVMDGDLQDPPEAVPLLLGTLDADGSSVAFAARRGAYEAAGRLRTSRAFKRSLARVARVPADAGMFFAARRDAAEALLTFRTDRPFLPAMIGLLGVPVSSVPVERSRRESGASAYTGWRRLRVGVRALLLAGWWRLGRRGEHARDRIREHNERQRDYYGGEEHDDLRPRPSAYRGGALTGAAAPAHDGSSRELRLTLLVGTAIVAAAALQLLTSATAFGDEGWFVQVCARVLAGERPYADVFFPATPLSLWPVLAAMRVFGTQVLVLKALAVLLFGGTALCVVAVARTRHVGVRAAAVLVAALFVFSPAGSSGPFYNALATFLLAASLVATLLWLESWEESPEAAGITVGVLLGLTLAAKQNVGVYATAAFLAVASYVWLRRRGSDGAALPTRSLAVAAAAYTTAMLVVLAPVVLSGSFPAFVRWTVGTRLAYVQSSAVPYGSALERLGVLTSGQRSLDDAAGLLLLALYLLPVPGLALPAAAFRRRRDAASLALLAFAAAAIASAFPRWDVRHLMLGAPLLLAACAASWPAVRPMLSARLGSILGRGAIVLVLTAAAVGLAANVQRLATGWYGPLGLPHFAGAIARRQMTDDTRSAAATLKASASRSGGIFILSPRAGTLYLGSGLANPTPDDYPSGHTTEAVQREIVAAIEDGRIGGLWYDRWQEEDPETLMPVLTGYIRERMEPEVRTTQGTLYRRKP